MNSCGLNSQNNVLKCISRITKEASYIKIAAKYFNDKFNDVLYHMIHEKEVGVLS